MPACQASGHVHIGVGTGARPPLLLRMLRGLVAQSVEQRPFKPLVQGSSPCQPTTFFFTILRSLVSAGGTALADES